MVGSAHVTCLGIAYSEASSALTHLRGAAPVSFVSSVCTYELATDASRGSAHLYRLQLRSTSCWPPLAAHLLKY